MTHYSAAPEFHLIATSTADAQSLEVHKHTDDDYTACKTSAGSGSDTKGQNSRNAALTALFMERSVRERCVYRVSVYVILALGVTK